MKRVLLGPGFRICLRASAAGPATPRAGARIGGRANLARM